MLIDDVSDGLVGRQTRRLSALSGARAPGQSSSSISALMFMALLTVIGVLVSDLLLAVLDPRIRLGGGAMK